MGVTCDHCGKPNHYAKMCLGKSQKPAGRGQGNRDHRSISNRPSGKREDSKKPKHRSHDARDDRKGANKSGSRPTRRTKHIEYQDQSSDYSSTNESDDSSTNSDDECYMQRLKTHHTSEKKTSQGKTCTVKINGNDTQVEPDTGSDTNIMDEHQFKKLQEKAPNVALKRSDIKLKALKEDLPVMGEADLFISNQTHTVSTIKGKMDSPPLIGRQTLEDLRT